MATKRNTPPLDKTGCAGTEGTLSKQVAGDKNCESYEAHNGRASSKGAQPRFATRPSPMIDLAPAKAQLKSHRGEGDKNSGY